MKYVLIKLLELYRKIPIITHTYCKFTPTCSEYAIAALKKYGTIKGLYLIVRRLLRCNPWNKGGYDPLP